MNIFSKSVEIFECIKNLIYTWIVKKADFISNVVTLKNGFLVTVWDGSEIFVSTNELYGEEEIPILDKKSFVSIQNQADKNSSNFLMRVDYRYI
ncbi:hypothetical protein [Paenibacillus sp. FSL H3-0333]|uniref:hypothetical protein n=1 Tax=Paenibacillus sp. FSL H3-0333 TaxID=2921373 RepID=UPI0030FCA4EF